MRLVRTAELETVRTTPRKLPERLPFPIKPGEPDWGKIGWEHFENLDVNKAIWERWFPPVMDRDLLLEKLQSLSDDDIDTNNPDQIRDEELDRLSNELLKPMVFPAFPRLDEINDFFKGLSVGILKNGTYLPCQIIGVITKNSDICDFPKTLEATDVNNECIYRAGILTADVASMISGVIMTVLGISSIIGGSVTSVGGIAVTGTGVGALVGIPTIVVSSGVVVSGVVQSVSGVSLVYSSVKSFSGDLDEFNMAKEGTSAGSGHMLGENGTRTDSITTGRNMKKERVDVENHAPGKMEGDVHYHEPDNTKWRYDVKLKKLVRPKTEELAPPRVQKVLKEVWFQKALKKALKILGE